MFKIIQLALISFSLNAFSNNSRQASRPRHVPRNEYMHRLPNYSSYELDALIKALIGAGMLLANTPKNHILQQSYHEQTILLIKAAIERKDPENFKEHMKHVESVLVNFADESLGSHTSTNKQSSSLILSDSLSGSISGEQSNEETPNIGVENSHPPELVRDTYPKERVRRQSNSLARRLNFGPPEQLSSPRTSISNLTGEERRDSLLDGQILTILSTMFIED